MTDDTDESIDVVVDDGVAPVPDHDDVPRAPEHTRARAVAHVLETIVLTLAVPGVGWLIDPRDPFFLNSWFPWLVFAPLLVALRHGFTLGLACVVGLDIALVLAWRTQMIPVARFPGEPLVGLFAVAMVAGQFTDVRTRRIARIRAESSGLQRRSNELARAHYLLELSHARLSEQAGRATGSLRDAIAAVGAMANSGERLSFSADGDAILRIFALHCGVEIGELFRVEHGNLGESCARLGSPEPINADDPLVVRAIRAKQLVHIPAVPPHDPDDPDDLDDTSPSPSPVLAAIPFRDERGAVRAVLCVQAMPFISFQRRNLETMATLARHLADLTAPARMGHGTAVRDARNEGLDVAQA